MVDHACDNQKYHTFTMGYNFVYDIKVHFEESSSIFNICYSSVYIYLNFSFLIIVKMNQLKKKFFA